MYYIDTISLINSDFFKAFRGAIHEDPIGMVYQETTATWVMGMEDSGGFGMLSYSENLNQFLMQAGTIKLQALGHPSDLFYSQEVHVTDHNLLHEEPFAFQGFGFGMREFWIDGAKQGNPDLEVPLCNQVLFGMYEDDYNRILGTETPYEVTLYIHYDTHQETH